MKKNLVFIACMVAGVSLAASDLILVEDGRPAVSVISGTTETEKFAVSEFVRIVKKITDADVSASQDGKTRLVIGTPETNEEIKKEAAFLGLDKKYDNDTFSLKTKGNTIYAAGINPRSAMFAVFALLEKLGVRWFWPTEHGEFLPKPSKNLFVSECNQLSTADFNMRWFGTHANMPKGEFMAHNRMVLTMQPDRKFSPKKFGGINIFGSVHTFGQMYPKNCKSNAEHFKKYPEHFALNEGVRISKQHCYTNPEVRKIFVEWLLDFWKNNPDTDWFGLGPMDTPYYCKCEECSKFDPSTLTYDFMTHIINEANKQYPDKIYRTASYSFYLSPPKNKLPNNLIITYCMYNRCYKHPFCDDTCLVNPRALEGLEKWRKAGVALGVYGYHFDAFPDSWLTPQAFVLADEFRTFKKLGIKYYTTENFFNIDFSKPLEKNTSFTNRFAVWLVTRMLWDSSLDEKELLKDFCTHTFGSAAPDMEEYYLKIQSAWAKQGHISHYFGNPEAHVDDFITSELIAEMDELLAKAKGKVAMEPRALELVTAEEKAWQKWRDLKRSRNNWGEIAEDMQSDRLKYLLAAQPGKTLYTLNTQDKNMLGWSSTAKVEVKHDDAENSDYLSFIPQKDHAKTGSHVLFGNNPKNFKTSCDWVNYELSFQFRFPEKAEKFMTLYVVLRSDLQSLRFEKYPFLSYRVGISPEWIDWEVREKGNVSNLYKKERAKIDSRLPVNEWVDVKIRVVDCRMVITVNGKEYSNAKVPLGGGVVNFLSYVKYDIRNVRVTEIESPSLKEMWTVNIPFSEKSPNMSGKGDDPVWNNAYRTSAFKTNSSSSVVQKTDVYLICTGNALYLRADCFEDMSKLRTIRTKNDDELWNDTNIEIYLDPNNTRTDYYYLIVNSSGVRYDALASIGLNLDSKWNGNWKAVVTQTQEKWIAEVELPFSTFADPSRDNSQWLMGLTRTGTGYTQSWTDGAYHSPNSFKTLIMKQTKK